MLRLIGDFLCFFRIHRWHYKSAEQCAHDGMGYQSSRRCKRCKTIQRIYRGCGSDQWM